MAGSHTDNKQKKSSGRWSILVVIAAVIAFVVIQLYLLDETRKPGKDEETETLVDTKRKSDQPISEGGVYGEIEEYMIFVSENIPDDPTIYVDEYVTTALKRFHQALVQLDKEHHINLNEATLAQLALQSDKIDVARETDQAEVVKNTFSMITQTMKSLQAKDAGQLQSEIQTLQQMAQNIETDMAIENQEDTISSFLVQVGTILKMIEE